MKKRNNFIDFLALLRSDLLDLIIVGMILALGVNLIANAIPLLLNFSPIFSLFTGFVLSILSLTFLYSKLFARRVDVREVESLFIYDKKKNHIVNIPHFEFGEDFTHYFRGAFLENPAIKEVWDKEPLSEIPEKVWEKWNTDLVEDYPKSMHLVSEAVEYYLLERLSTHLQGYFSGDEFSEKNLQKFSRGDIPQVLLRNRFLELFSRPMIDRERFVQYAFEEDDDTSAIWNEDGTIYSKFELILPKNSKVFRPESNIIEIRTSRMNVTLQTKFEGFSANLPRGFANYYLGITEVENDEFFEEFMSFQLNIKVKAAFSFGALFSIAGWNYYRWLDSFFEKLESDFSSESFFARINWKSVHTTIMALRNANLSDD